MQFLFIINILEHLFFLPFVLVPIIIIVKAVRSAKAKEKEQPTVYNPYFYQNNVYQKSKCEYCGTILESTDTTCPNCGAPKNCNNNNQ